MSPPVAQLQDENIRFPRMRGDEPSGSIELEIVYRFSPHARG